MPSTRESSETSDPSGRRAAVVSADIEFLAPDANAFGDVDGGSAGTFVGFDSVDWDDAEADRAPRSRWAPALAGLAVAGLLVGGVIAASPWSADDTGAAPTTTEAVRPPTSIATTGQAPSSGTVDIAEPGVEGWVFDPPVAGLTAVAFAQDPEGDDQDSVVGRNGWAEVWATEGATRTTGRWFSLTLHPGVALEPVDLGWAAVDAGGRDAVARRSRDGVLELRVASEPGRAGSLISIQSYGFSLPESIELATTIDAIGTDPPIDDDGFDDEPGLYDGLTMVASRPTSDDLVDLALVGASSTSTVYYAGPGRRDISVLQRRRVGAIEPALARLAFTPTLTIDPATAFDGFAPDLLQTGTRSIDGTDVNVVRWSVGDDDVWLLTTLSSGVLPAMLDDARRVTREEWATARDEAERADPPSWLFTEDEEIPVPIADGITATGAEWAIAIGPRSGRFFLKVPGIGSTDTTFDALVGTARDGSLGTMVVDGSTLVFAAIDRDGATLRVRLADGSERTTALTPLPTNDEPPTEPGRLDPSFWTSWSGAQVGVVTVDPDQVALGAYAAEVLAADGTVVATLDLFAGV